MGGSRVAAVLGHPRRSASASGPSLGGAEIAVEVLGAIGLERRR